MAVEDNRDFTSLFSSAIEFVLKDALDKTATEEDKTKINQCLESIDFQKFYLELFNIAEDDTFLFMKKRMFEVVMKSRADDLGYIAFLEQQWGQAFVASESLYLMTFETSESYSKYVESLAIEDVSCKYWTYVVMKCIHGRALQEYLEIITLMKNGFTDGAYARWRSMYELSIIGSFILQNGENVAKKFYEASGTDDRYDWAKESGLFSANKKHITFNDLQNACDINTDVWKAQYDLANKIVHASPQGTFSRLGAMGNYPEIPAGRTNYGFSVPGEHSAISLAQISSMFFTLFPESDTLVQTKIITRWIDVIREAYFKAHDELFPEEKPLWSDYLNQKNS